MENYKNIVADVLSIAKNKGVEADCILDTNSHLSLKAENNELSEHKVSSTMSLGVRIIKNNKIGTSYSESWEKESLDHMVNEAIEFSKYTKDEPLETITLSRPDEFNGTTDQILQEDDTSLEDKIKFSLSLESEIKAKDKFVKSSPYNNFSESESQRIYGNHLGTLCTQKSKSFSCFTSALIEKENQQSMHHHVSVARKFKDLDFESVINESYLHAHQLLGAKPIKTGNYDIIFTTDSLASLFDCFDGLFSAKAAMLDANPWKNKIGDELAVKDFSISDDPTYAKAFSYSPFDDEGEFTKSLDLIQNGKLNSFFHNSVTAKHFKTDNTFHAARSPKSTLSVSGTNTIIKESSHSDTDVRKDQHVEIITMQGLHSGADAISGNFSFGASGYLKEGSEIIQSIAGVTISGNFFQLLRDIKQIGNKHYNNPEKSFFAPTIRFGGLRVAGN